MNQDNHMMMGLALVLALALAGPGHLSAQENPETGWLSLWNGKDFDGWQFHLGKEGADNHGTFAIQEGMLVCSGRPAGYMYTTKSYRNYTLQLEWMFQRPEGLTDDTKFRGNSGCLIHLGAKNALGVWPRCIEVQGSHRDPGLILPIPRNLPCKHTFDRQALEKVRKPVGAWNKMQVEVNGATMVISINGAVVSTVTDCELTEGPIGLQSENAPTRWRNIRIREK